MSVVFYYSNHCKISKGIMNILSQHPAKNKMILICVDTHYKQHNTFPEDIRGVPTIHLEQGNNITAYEGKHAVEFIENFMIKCTQQPEGEKEKKQIQSNFPMQGNVTGVPVQVQPNNDVPDWAAAATLTPEKMEELKKKGAGEYDASFLKDPRFKGRGKEDTNENREQQAKLMELQKNYGGGDAGQTAAPAEQAPAKPSLNDVMSGKNNGTKGNLLK